MRESNLIKVFLGAVVAIFAVTTFLFKNKKKEII